MVRNGSVPKGFAPECARLGATHTMNLLMGKRLNFKVTAIISFQRG